MDKLKRKHQILHAIFVENPALAEMLREADEEGVALYGRAYVPGADFIVLALEANLLPEAWYEQMHATMTRHPSMALDN